MPTTLLMVVAGKGDRRLSDMSEFGEGILMHPWTCKCILAE